MYLDEVIHTFSRILRCQSIFNLQNFSSEATTLFHFASRIARGENKTLILFLLVTVVLEGCLFANGFVKFLFRGWSNDLFMKPRFFPKTRDTLVTSSSIRVMAVM